MKIIVKWFSVIIVVLFASFSTSHGSERHNHEGKSHLAAVESLSPDLRELLAKEMQALQKGMMSIIPAYASGNWKEIEDIASKMENSYILKQSITETQVKELHRLLPESFIKLDQKFHYYAGMLSHVAMKRKPELVGFYFSKLSESCVSCHSQYATHRFPDFIKKESKKHSH